MNQYSRHSTLQEIEDTKEKLTKCKVFVGKLKIV